MLPLDRSRFIAFTLCLFTASASADAQPPLAPPIQGGPIQYESNGLPVGVPETTGGYHGEPMQRYDAAYPWLHGYFQEIPAYGGFGSFRPYNYKHIFSQSQAAGGWGMPPAMPYAQQYWHRYLHRARMAPRYSSTNRKRSQSRSKIAPVRYQQYR